MSRGIDTPQNTAATADCLRKAGYGFVGRYYNVNVPAKNLTRDEAVALSRAGLYLVAVWENGFPTSPGYFSHARGVHDGTSAYHYAMHEIGQPAGAPIYFVVDYDASLADVAGGIHDYFRGVRDGFATISGGHPSYPIGVYGSGSVCAWLKSHTDFVTYAWLAQSTGWSGYGTFQDWNVKQGPTERVCDLDVDGNETNGRGGGFKVETETALAAVGEG